jgi:NSS family neurotransmitter:Na+ symporter
LFPGKLEVSQTVDGSAPRPVWTSQRTYILASIAGVVGLGNIWRFPYMAGENGGGSFVLAYAICIFAIGIPLTVLEASAGRLAGRGPVGLFRRINPRWGPWVGWFLVAMATAIMSYYLVVSGWTLGYAIDAIRMNLVGFGVFTSGFASLYWLLVIGALSVLVLRRGITGLESISKILLPLLVLVVGGLAIYSQTLPQAGAAREFYFSCDMEHLLDPGIWRMAAGQAFYSLAIGQGFLITYGSYIPRGVNVVKASAAVAGTNSVVSITAGLMIFPIVFSFGIAPDAGSALAFTALPAVFGELSGGAFISIAFYLLLFVAAFTSCLGGLAVVLAPVRDEFHLSQRRAALVVVALVTALGIPSALSFTPVNLTVGGQPFLDMMDKVTGSGVVIVAGMVGAALIAWMIPRKQLLDAINCRGFLPGWLISVGRYLILAAIALLVITLLA